MALQSHPHAVDQRRMITDSHSKIGEALVYKVVTNMHTARAHSLIAEILLFRSLRQLESGRCYLRLSDLCISCNFCDAFTILFAAVEFHPRVSLRRILLQHSVKGNKLFDDSRPCPVSNIAHTLDARSQDLRGAGCARRGRMKTSAGLRENPLQQQELE